MVDADQDLDLVLLNLHHWNDDIVIDESTSTKTTPPLSNSNSTTSLPEFRGASAVPENPSIEPNDHSMIRQEVVGMTKRRRRPPEPYGSSEHDVHIFTERERRKKMRSMFSELHALLPHLPQKVDKSTVVDEAVVYIKSLENTLQDLQKRKEEKGRETFLADQGSCCTSQKGKPAMKFPHCSFQTWTSPNVVLNICGEDAHIAVCSTWKVGLFSSIVYILDKYKLDVVTAHISSDNNRSIYMFHVHAMDHSNQLQETKTIEEQFKLAVGEMIICLSY